MYDGDKATVDHQVTNGKHDRESLLTCATIRRYLKDGQQALRHLLNIGPVRREIYIFRNTADGKEGYITQRFPLSFLESDSLYYRTLVEVRTNASPRALTFGG